MSSKQAKFRKKLKQKLIDYMGGKCMRCGYDKKIPPCYEFHHTDPSEKEFSISNRDVGFEKKKKEVDKCELLCVMCHRELHWELDNDF